jgi:hypothetical protein
MSALDLVGALLGTGSGRWVGQAQAIVREVTGDPDAHVALVEDEADPWAMCRRDGTEIGCGHTRSRR